MCPCLDRSRYFSLVSASKDAHVASDSQFFQGALDDAGPVFPPTCTASAASYRRGPSPMRHLLGPIRGHRCSSYTSCWCEFECGFRSFYSFMFCCLHVALSIVLVLVQSIMIHGIVCSVCIASRDALLNTKLVVLVSHSRAIAFSICV